MLSKPYPESSCGKSSAGLRSTPSRSRIGVVVLRAVQPTDGDAARIGHGRAVDAIELEIDPRRHGGHRLRIGPRILLRRHLAGADLRERLLPGIRVAGDRVDSLERLEVQAAALAPLAVAGNAGVFEKRLDGRLESRGVRGIGRRLPRRRRAERAPGRETGGRRRASATSKPFGSKEISRIVPDPGGCLRTSTTGDPRTRRRTENGSGSRWITPASRFIRTLPNLFSVRLCALCVSVVDVRDQRLAVAGSAAGTSRATRPPSKVT